jgi:hypothetical protein
MLGRAWDIQMHRGWSAYLTEHGWGVCDGLVAGVPRSPLLANGAGKMEESELARLLYHPDPVTALVVAEAWYVANV